MDGVWTSKGEWECWKDKIRTEILRNLQKEWFNRSMVHDPGKFDFKSWWYRSMDK